MTAKLSDIVVAVSKVCNVSPVAVRGERRFRKLSRARMLVCFLAREIRPDLSMPMIGRFLNRDHTTVLHACRRIMQLLMTDVDLQADLKATRALLAQGPQWPDDMPLPCPKPARGRHKRYAALSESEREKYHAMVVGANIPPQTAIRALIALRPLG